MTCVDRTPLVRAALAIQRQLGRRRSAIDYNELPTAAFARCQRLLSVLTIAERRSWPAAAAVCRDQLRRALHDLRRQIDASARELDGLPTRARISLRDVYEDLAALSGEFEGAGIDIRGRLISVTTEPIELEGVYLGRFSIVLDWERLTEGSGCYEVIALDPQPAAADSSVTHPHVRDGQLCEGEGASAIRAALRAGRLLDFFTIVARTLASYNAGSAYVSLDHWAGVCCADCGATTDEDDRSCCEACECELCCSCGGGCSDCGRTNCNECSRSCDDCCQYFCKGCLDACAICNHHYCERCLDDGQCSKCREAAAEEDARGEAQADSPAASTAGLASDPVRLGEAALPA